MAPRDDKPSPRWRTSLVTRVMDWLRASHRGAPSAGTRRAANPDALVRTVRARDPANAADADLARSERLAALAARQAARAKTRKRIEYEQKILHRTHLDASLLLLLKETRDWLARSQHGVLTQNLPFDAQDIGTQANQSPGVVLQSIEFTFHGARYRIEVDIGAERTHGDRTGKLRFLQNDKIVLSAHLFGPADGDAASVHWDRLKVDTLEPGPWVGHIGEMEEQIRFARERPVLQQELARLMGEDDGSPKTG